MSDGQVRIAPSLLAADSTDLHGAVSRLEDVVEVFHVDVMDGHFVPNISMGPAVVADLRKATDRVLDVHLMIETPEHWVERFCDAGADWISVHREASVHLERTLDLIRQGGARAGVALNPATSGEGLEHVLEDGDLVLVMTVNPGFAGQAFLPRMLDKVVELRRRLEDARLADVDIEVDGGVGPDNAADCIAAGAGILVAGSSVYGAADPVEAVRRMQHEAEARPS